MPDTPTWMNLILFVAGLAIIIKGSDLFLDSAIWIARASGIPQVIIGATIVSLCTTLPELVASSVASAKGAVDIALGNAVGSVICNTGLILAFMLLFIVVRIRREVFLVKGVFMLGALLAGLFLALPSGDPDAGYRIGRAEGLVLLVILMIFMVVNYYESLHAPDESPAHAGGEPPTVPEAVERREWPRHLALFAAGAGTVMIGAYLLVEFGQRMARDLGIGEAVIALVFVAFGTSLPELFTAISAVRKKAAHISIGNIFGANVLNLTLVTGCSAVIRPLAVTDQRLFTVDIPVALLVCTVAFGSGLLKGRVGRGTGIVLLVLYAAYLASLFVLKRGAALPV